MKVEDIEVYELKEFVSWMPIAQLKFGSSNHCNSDAINIIISWVKDMTQNEIILEEHEVILFGRKITRFEHNDFKVCINPDFKTVTVSKSVWTHSIAKIEKA